MADKEVWIENDNGQYVKITNPTSIKESPEVSNSTTQTMDGALTRGTANIPYTIEISRLRYEGLLTHMELSIILDNLLSNPRGVMVCETIRPENEDPYRIINYYRGGILDDNSSELSPEDFTSETIKIKCAGRTKREYTTEGIDENTSVIISSS